MKGKIKNTWMNGRVTGEEDEGKDVEDLDLEEE